MDDEAESNSEGGAGSDSEVNAMSIDIPTPPSAPTGCFPQFSDG